MILPLKTNARERDLKEIIGCVAILLAHLASAPEPGIDDAGLRAATPRAESLLSALRRHVEALVQETTQEQRRLLADAFENDMRFDERVDSREFRLRFPGLPQALRRSAEPLLGALYDMLARGGLSIDGEDGRAIVVDRAALERGFFERNDIQACPACTEETISLTSPGLPASNDCDHFLPRSIYGPLAIHPQNLVFTCLRCNQRLKGRGDPLAGRGPAAERARRRGRAGALRTSYLPYRRPALPEMKIEFAEDRVMLAADSADGRERVANLDRLLKLERLWSDVLPRAEREMFEGLKGPPTRRAVKAVLDDVARRGAGAPEGLGPGVFLRSRYAASLQADRFDVLVAEWKRKSAERRRSAALYGG